jgi:hypothetical protein
MPVGAKAAYEADTKQWFESRTLFTDIHKDRWWHSKYLKGYIRFNWSSLTSRSRLLRCMYNSYPICSNFALDIRLTFGSHSTNLLHLGRFYAPLLESGPSFLILVIPLMFQCNPILLL